MVQTYTLAYLRTRSLPELFTLRAALQQKLAALPPQSVERADVALVLDQVHWLLASRGPGFRPG